MSGDWVSARWPRHLVAVALFTVVALWCNRAVLDHPATVVNFDPVMQSSRYPAELVGSDMTRGLTQLVYAARTLSTRPLEFFDGAMCHPSADSVTFGEHMLGEGLQGLPVYLFSGDPVITYNFVGAFKPWIAALSMYALALYWTGNSAAAMIAGLLFGFHPMRLLDLQHPSVRANEWMPLVLLLLDLVFTRRQWRYAVMLAAVGSAQCLESMYVLLHYALIVGIYGTYLCFKHWRTLPKILPQLLLATLPIAGTAWAALGPYLGTREAWGILEGRRAWAFPTQVFLGHGLYPGNSLLLLAAIGLLDRFLGKPRRRVHDPRLALALAAFAVTWFVLPLPTSWAGFNVPSLRSLAQSWVPGLGAIRAPNNVFVGIIVPLALLAAYGARALADAVASPERGASWRRASAFAIIALVCAAEIMTPAWADWTFGQPIPSAPFPMRPPEADLVAVRDLPPGPVLDLPGNYSFLWAGHLSRYVLLGAYHQQRVSSCKSSFLTPVQHEVNAIARRLPDPDAARELWALGFRNVIFHVQNISGERRRADAILEALREPDGPHLIPIAAGETVRVARLVADGPITTDVRSLSIASRGRLPSILGEKGLRFGVKAGAATFRHADPIEPTTFRVTWKRGRKVAHEESVRGLLPLALAAERTTDIAVDAKIVGVSHNRYDVTLSIAGDPEILIGREQILVLAKSAVDPPAPR